MFTIKKIRYDITYLVPIIYVNQILIEHEETSVTLQAATTYDTLELYGFSGSMRFVEDDLTEYNAPLQGSDFLTAKTGSLFILISENIPFGLYRSYLVDSALIPGVCGWGVLGCVQGGNNSRYIEEAPIVLQVQSLLDDWIPGIVSTQQYAVNTIVRP